MNILDRIARRIYGGPDYPVFENAVARDVMVSPKYEEIMERLADGAANDGTTLSLNSRECYVLYEVLEFVIEAKYSNPGFDPPFIPNTDR